MRHRRVSSNVYVGVMNSEARSCSPQFSVETSEMLGDDRLNSRVRGWLVVGRRRPSSHYRCVAFQIFNLSVDVLFSADGHFPTSRIQSGPNRSAARSAESEFGASRRYPDCPQYRDGCHAWVEPSTPLGPDRQRRGPPPLDRCDRDERQSGMMPCMPTVMRAPVSTSHAARSAV
jgi:hypothetical protein